MRTPWTTQRAALAGTGVLILGQVLFFGLSQHEPLRLILLSTPALAAFVAAYFAPRWKILVGLSMAVVGAAIGELMARAYEYLGGHVDHIGGMLATLLVLLAYNGVLSSVGSVAGAFLSRKRSKHAKSTSM